MILKKIHLLITILLLSTAGYSQRVTHVNGDTILYGPLGTAAGIHRFSGAVGINIYPTTGLVIAALSSNTSSILNIPLGSINLFQVLSNGRMFAGNLPTGIGDKAMRYNTTTKEFTWADTTIGGGGSVNIYNTDDTLTGDRIVDGGTNSITFQNVGDYDILANNHFAVTAATDITLQANTFFLKGVTAGASTDSALVLNTTTKQVGYKAFPTNGSSGTLTNLSIVTANGLAGTVTNSTTTPAVTLSTTITGLLKGNGTSISAVVSGTDIKTINGVSPLGSGDIGTINIAHGGTNNGSLPVTAGTIYYGNGTQLVGLAPGTTKQHLTGGVIPSWVDTTASGSNLGNTDLVNSSGGVRTFDNNFKSLFFPNTGLLRISRSMGNYGFKYDFNKTLDLNNIDSIYTVGINAESGTQMQLYYQDLNNLDTNSTLTIKKNIKIQSEDSLFFGTHTSDKFVITPVGHIIANGLPTGIGNKAVRWNNTTHEFSLADTTINSSYTPSGTTGYYPYYSSSSTLAGTGPIYTDGSGKVGVGTTTPTGKLDVYGPAIGTGINLSTLGDVMLGEAGSGVSVFFGGTYSYAAGDYIRHLSGATKIGIYTGGYPSVVAAGANVGIGTATPSQALDVVGNIKGKGFFYAYVEKTANYTATADDETINITSGSPTITLPTSVGITGRVYDIVNSNSVGTVTIATTSSQTFMNMATTPTTLTITGLGSFTVQATGANWIIK